jgi:hypothetical protein
VGPNAGSDSFNNDKERLRATDERDIEEAKVHVETGALDVEDEASTGRLATV